MRGDGRIYQRGRIFWVEYWHHGQAVRESSKGFVATKGGTPGVQTQIPANAFFEGGFNLSSQFQISDLPCFSHFVAQTATSAGNSASVALERRRVT